MEKRDRNKQISDRRNFLKKGLVLGGGAVVAGGVNSAISPMDEKENKIKAITPQGKVIEVNESHAKEFKKVPSTENGNLRKGIPGRKFVMVIDLSKCKNERKCQKGCRSMHQLPEDVNWLKVYKMKESEATSPYWMPSPCQHCDNPPCVKVCPVDATFIREDGVVLIDNKRCIGCRFCMAACPYSARTFIWSEPVRSTNYEKSEDKCHNSAPRILGTVEKCDFCTGELAEGKLPKCVSSCPNGVFYMGDINEDTISNNNETIRFSEIIESKAGYRFLENLGTNPSVYYLPPYNRLFPFEDEQKG